MRPIFHTRKTLFIVFLLGFYCYGYGQLRISEIMFNPTGPEQSDEFIEIVNLDTALSLDLTDWKIGDGEGDDRIVDAGEGMQLAPGVTGLILDPDYFSVSGTYNAIIPQEALLLTLDGSTFGSGGLSNSHSETVCLMDPSSMIVDSISYVVDILPGHSFEKMKLTGVGSLNWRESLAEHGTPGFRNSTSPAAFDLSIIDLDVRQETSQEPEGLLFIVQVLNAGLEPALNARLVLFKEVREDSVWTEDEQIGFQLLSVLQPGDTSQCTFKWKAEPGVYCYAAIIFFDADEIDGNNKIEKPISIPYSSGALVINEIMYEPAEPAPEWVELFNTLTSSVNLDGWFISDSDTLHRTLLSPSSLWIRPSDFLVLYCSVGLESCPAPETIHCQAVEEFPGLNNTEDSFFLFDPSGRIIDRVNFKCSWGGGDGVSLERIYWNRSSEDSSNWYGCIRPDGMSPGEKNSLNADLPDHSVFNIDPNPFSPDGDGRNEVTCIHYRLAHPSVRVSLTVYDVRGRRIRDLRNGQLCRSEETIIWDGLDNSGQRVRTGIYIIYLDALSQSGNIIQKKRTVVLAETT